MQVQHVTFQLFDTVNRLHTGTCPVTDVCTGAKKLATTGYSSQYAIRVPVIAWFRVVVNSYLDLIFITQAGYCVPMLTFRLRSDHLDAHCLCKFKHFAPFLLTTRRYHSVSNQFFLLCLQQSFYLCLP